jgi:glycosyltransferase involved in cell wall biosynthesis
LSTSSELPLSVLTVTRRTATLPRCLASVAAQDHTGPIEHLIVIDDQPEVRELLHSTDLRPGTEIRYASRGPSDVDGPDRLARLRNLAVESARNPFIVFLDDDNAWEPDHLSSLSATLTGTGAAIAHSERKMFLGDGAPYAIPEFPWCRDPSQRREIYRTYTELGIVTPGSNVFRDRLRMPYSCVDLGEWLLPRDFLKEHPFEGTYSTDDWQAIVVEDGKLAEEIKASGLPVESTHRPTLHYYLGGYSNNFQESASIYWQRPAQA